MPLAWIINVTKNLTICLNFFYLMRVDKNAKGLQRLVWD